MEQLKLGNKSTRWMSVFFRPNCYCGIRHFSLPSLDQLEFVFSQIWFFMAQYLLIYLYIYSILEPLVFRLLLKVSLLIRCPKYRDSLNQIRSFSPRALGTCQPKLLRNASSTAVLNSLLEIIFRECAQDNHCWDLWCV